MLTSLGMFLTRFMLQVKDSVALSRSGRSGHTHTDTQWWEKHVGVAVHLRGVWW